MLELNKVYKEDCVGENGMCLIEDKSIDMILCDLPYGQTARNKWDVVIPFENLWEQYLRIIKDNGSIVLFANGMFTSDLMQSNRKLWRYNIVWNKIMTTGFLNANRMPLRCHEDICVFYKKLPTYNPQKFKGEGKSHSKGKKDREDISGTNYGKAEMVDKSEEHGDMKFPASIITFYKVHPSLTIHPTQKPVELCEWLINTYTNKNNLILDNCMGSFTTAVACKNTNRNYIGFENDNTYYELGQKRLEYLV